MGCRIRRSQESGWQKFSVDEQCLIVLEKEVLLDMWDGRRVRRRQVIIGRTIECIDNVEFESL